MEFVFAIPIILFPFLVLVNFGYYLSNRTFLNNEIFFRFIEIWTVILLPFIYLSMADLNEINNCCTDSAVFSPGHRSGIYLIILICTASYFYCTYRKKLAPPLQELLINIFILTGLVFNVLFCIHVQKSDPGLWLIGNAPIILLFLMVLVKNHRFLTDQLLNNEDGKNKPHQNLTLRLLVAKPLLKYPILLLLSLPVLILISLCLFVFGQKPDTLIRAFTDTYKHGFSQLDYMCDNVQCGGHYLCSVAANGHKSIVKPIRYGQRHGHKIICNRQLLIANAFEQLMQEKLPWLHKPVRKHYNKVGNLIHRYYSIFNCKGISDIVYFLMKPFEWIFLVVLYFFDQKPENRIASQYLDNEVNNMIKSMM